MSKYPGNPYWNQTEDVPVAIFMKSDWDEAESLGFIVPEHVFSRLGNIAIREFGQEGPAAYDEDGFYLSLVAAGLEIAGGVRLVVHTNDHPPAHVHIEAKSIPGLRLRLRLDNAEPLDPIPDGWAKKTRRIQLALRENHQLLSGWWETYHGEFVVLE